MTGDYDARRETDAERADREHDRHLARRDRLADHAPAGEYTDAELDRAAEHSASGATPVLPRDIDDHHLARAVVEGMAETYDSVEVDRMPPMGALQWLVTGRKDGHAARYKVTAAGHITFLGYGGETEEDR